MRKHLFIPVLLAAMLLASCSKDTPAKPQGEPGATTSLSFSYPVPVLQSRATTVPASELEKAMYDLSIFAYIENGAFVARLTNGTDYEETINGNTATIDCTHDFLIANAGQTLVFYFVANDAASKGGTHTDGIDYANLTAQQFENSLCAPLPDHSNPGQVYGIEDLEWDYIPASGGKHYGLLMTAKSEPIRIMGRQTKKVTLIRRSARFDIRNDFKDTYEMTKISISSAQVQGQLFGTGQIQTPAAPKSYRTMDGPDKDEYGQLNPGEYIYNGWFYLYPTTIAEGATEITIVVTRLADDATTHITLDGSHEIKANHRYTLVFNATNLTFTLDDNTGDYGDDKNP